MSFNSSGVMDVQQDKIEENNALLSAYKSLSRSLRKPLCSLRIHYGCCHMVVQAPMDDDLIAIQFQLERQRLNPKKSPQVSLFFLCQKNETDAMPNRQSKKRFTRRWYNWKKDGED